ncbi:hypothetical protein LY78DRAFT_297918 [Colletotrichum sublineola]|nr:hypothetical protein LY78DRAFT_297918 [Colletotrichum sublineola]
MPDIPALGSCSDVFFPLSFLPSDFWILISFFFRLPYPWACIVLPLLLPSSDSVFSCLSVFVRLCVSVHHTAVSYPSSQVRSSQNRAAVLTALCSGRRFAGGSLLRYLVSPCRVVRSRTLSSLVMSHRWGALWLRHLIVFRLR